MRRATLPLQISLINHWSPLVLVIEDPLDISSWSQIAPCELMNISNLKFKKWNLFYDVLLLNPSHPTTIKENDKFELLSSRICDREIEWGGSLKVLREYFYIEGYWELVKDVLGQHGKFLKKCIWSYLHPCLATIAMLVLLEPFANIDVLLRTPCILPLGFHLPLGFMSHC